jgi:hypothetical protein
MNLIERVKGMLLSPKTEWPKVAAEPMTVQGIYTGWVMILAAISALAILIGTRSLSFAIVNYVILLLMTGIVALVVDVLAPRFGGTKDFVAALKLSAFSYTAAFVAGVFQVLGIVGSMLMLVAMFYAWYTFYLGAPVLKKSTPEKALVFTIAVVVIGFVLGMLFGLLAQGGGLAPRMAM